jgi:hypothetical protein
VVKVTINEDALDKPQDIQRVHGVGVADHGATIEMSFVRQDGGATTLRVPEAELASLVRLLHEAGQESVLLLRGAAMPTTTKSAVRLNADPQVIPAADGSLVIEFHTAAGYPLAVAPTRDQTTALVEACTEALAQPATERPPTH